jgi:3-deoxy-D-manno-octulosonate 8-phosphate phosphatase (KDO 8-P phosphatase)
VSTAGSKPALSGDLAAKARRIRLVLTDCDGVLTDGGVYYGEQGEVMKRFNIKDGMATERLRKLAGIDTGIVTGERSPSVQRRAEKLGIAECHLYCKDKDATLRSIFERLNLSAEDVAYIGDDVNDLPAFALAGLTACPADAVDEVKGVVDVVLQRPGGHGVFREFAELILKAREA